MLTPHTDFNKAVKDIRDGYAADAAAWLQLSKAYNEFGSALMRERLANKESKRALARRTGFSPAYISDVEKGMRGPHEKLLTAY